VRGAAAGGPVRSIARRIARPFTSWSDTTPAPNFGTESNSDAHPSRPGDSAVTQGAETDGGGSRAGLILLYAALTPEARERAQRQIEEIEE
jgi:hypothetical protein